MSQLKAVNNYRVESFMTKGHHVETGWPASFLVIPLVFQLASNSFTLVHT